MKIEVKQRVPSELNADIRDVDSIECDRLFVDADGCIGVIVYVDYEDEYFVVWLTAGKFKSTNKFNINADLGLISLPVRYLDSDKQVILTNE